MWLRPAVASCGQLWPAVASPNADCRQRRWHPAHHAGGLVSTYCPLPIAGERDAVLMALRVWSAGSSAGGDSYLHMQTRWHEVIAQGFPGLHKSDGRVQDAVLLALSFDMSLASSTANRPEEEPALKRSLWLTIACHLVEQHPSQDQVNFLLVALGPLLLLSCPGVARLALSANSLFGALLPATLQCNQADCA